ncbi:hypothetical protein VRRI112168_20100 [Vreelandella rituensis]
MQNENPGPWTAKQQQAMSDAIDAGLSGKALIEGVCAETGRSAASVERRLVKIGYLNCHSEPWNRAWGHVR